MSSRVSNIVVIVILMLPLYKCVALRRFKEITDDHSKLTSELKQLNYRYDKIDTDNYGQRYGQRFEQLKDKRSDTQ